MQKSYYPHSCLYSSFQKTGHSCEPQAHVFQNLAHPWISFCRCPCFENTYQLCRSTSKQNNDIIVLIFRHGRKGKALELVTLRISFRLKLQGGGRASRSEKLHVRPTNAGRQHLQERDYALFPVKLIYSANANNCSTL